MQNFRFFAGLGGLFGTVFLHFFVIFFVYSVASARSTRALTRDTKAVCGKPEVVILVLGADFLPPLWSASEASLVVDTRVIAELTEGVDSS